ncbi:MAG: preprotein translocase subunit SecE [Ruminococcus sp.]|nr:preprotein translocase subunit SecE [Ruminococcus sp.]
MAKKDQVAKSSKKDAEKTKKKGGIKQYFKELRSELKKVVWPTRKQVVNNTGVVLSVMAVMAVFLFAVDAGLGKIFEVLLSIGK